MFPDMSELLFSILVSYMGALEFMFVMRHLYHWIFQHQKRLLLGDKNEESLEVLQDRIKKAIDEAAEMEIPGFKAMKDGVLYKDGFRVDPSNEQIVEEKENIPKREIIGSSTSDLVYPTEEVHEEPCIKKEIKRVTASPPNNEVQQTEIIKNERTNLTQTIKTQIGQTNAQINLGQSEDSSSIEPASSQKTSSLSNQQSSSIETTFSMPEIHFDEYERQAPDGEDVPEQHYSDEYLRSLDGIKHRPLVREDGTGRRRAFKKRKSSESTSSRESRASREEELKMFTSLEEEEFASMKRGDSDYVPIRYSSEPNLKVGKHHKRHKKSPVKDAKHSADIEESKSSLEMLDEEEHNPWGDIKPEHYKNSEFWIREKAISIEEEDDEEHIKSSSKKSRHVLQAESPFRNIPQASSFEDATDSQHQEALDTLRKQSSYDNETKEIQYNENVGENKNVSSADEITQSLAENLNASSSHMSDDKFAYRLTAWDASNDLSYAGISAKLHESSSNDTEKLLEIDQSSEDEDVFGNRNIDETSEEISTTNEEDESDHTLTELDDIAKMHESESMEIDQEQLSRDDNVLNESGYSSIISKEIPNADETQEQNKHENEPVQKICQTEDLLEESESFHTERSSFNDGISIETDTNGKPLFRPYLRHNKKDYNLSLQADSDEDEPEFNNLENNTSSSQEIESEDSELQSEYQEFSSSIPSIEIDSEHLMQVQSDPLIYTGEQTSDNYPNESLGLLEGISDFYDFNASINPSRSPSVDRVSRKSRTPEPYIRSSPEEAYKSTILKAEEMNGLSDFYDFNVILNQAAYGNDVKRQRDAHRSSVDYLVEKLSPKQHQFLTTSTIESHRSSDTNVTSLSFLPNKQLEPDSPSSLDCQRSFSTEQKDVDRIRQMQINARLTYMGDGAVSEEMGEEERHFIRSRSQSRSILDVVETSDEVRIARKQLQDKILAEITQTTINYQEFSRDMSQKFIDHERRGSDSALLVKPEILIQFQDEQRDDEFDENELEAEEYHHFRRFSLNQDYQVEEYPHDDYVYVEQIEVQTSNGTRNWIREDFYDPSDRERFLSVETEAMHNSDQGENDDLDTGSEDERQTIVDVNDEIDGDVWDSDKPEDFNNYQTEEEEEPRTYENGNLNEGDWKEEGAVGGVYEENIVGTNSKYSRVGSVEIEEIYDEAVKNTVDADIQRDFETICNAATEKPNEIDDVLSIKTEDLLEEILNEEDEKYHWRNKMQTSSFIEHERGTATSKTTSTRLRTRYGVGTSSLSYTSYEAAENSSTEATYTPKKEYNWRKNFKLDDDDDNDDESTTKETVKANKKLSFQVEEESITEEQSESHQKFLDMRKYSLGGESITLYSRSPDRFQDFTGEYGLDEDTIKISDGATLYEKSAEMLSTEVSEEIKDSEIAATNIKIDEPELTAVTKKKKKKKGRKNSKESIEGDIESNSRRTSLADEQGLDDEDLKKKSKRKKRKSKDNSAEDHKTTTSHETQSILKSVEESKQKSAFIDRASKSSSGVKTDNKTELKTNSPITPTQVDKPKESKTNPDIKPKDIKEKIIKSTDTATEIETKPKIVDDKTNESKENPISATTRPPFERSESSGVYELIKDGSMYPWF